jgi:hypothetical protein
MEWESMFPEFLNFEELKPETSSASPDSADFKKLCSGWPRLAWSDGLLAIPDPPHSLSLMPSAPPPVDSCH